MCTCVSTVPVYLPTCVSTYMCIYLPTCVSTYLNTCVSTYMCTCVSTYLCTCVSAYLCTCVSSYLNTCVSTYICTYTCGYHWLCEPVLYTCMLLVSIKCSQMYTLIPHFGSRLEVHKLITCSTIAFIGPMSFLLGNFYTTVLSV